MSAPGGYRPPTQTQQEPPANELERFCFDRLEEAKRDSIPVSRHQIAESLARKHSIRFREAFDIVDTYCDERSPGTPEYLGKEFLVPYMKLSGLVFAALAVIVVIATVIMYRPGDRQFAWGMGIGVLFGLLAGSVYVRGLLREFAADK